jgi:hypothetical protein
MHRDTPSDIPARPLTRQTLRTPRAAAIAGVIFSVLMVAILWLIRESVPPDPLESGMWLEVHEPSVALAVQLVPFAGIAFLWFLGALRDRLGADEDKFFATVFLGSALLFLAMLFVAAAMLGALLLASGFSRDDLARSDVFALTRASIFGIMNIYAVKMAAVFMFSTSTVVIYARFAPYWLGYIGFALAAVLLFGGSLFGWGLIVLPVWVLAVSLCLLTDNSGLGGTET